MLFMLNSLDESKLKEIEILGGSEDKSILLYGDAAYYAVASMQPKLSPFEFEEIFVMQDALAARGISPHQDVLAVDYDKAADVLLNDHDRVVSL